MYPHQRTIIAVIITMLSYCNISFSQKNIGIKGSFFIAAIAKDGIMLATESRGNFYDIRTQEQTPLAYFDGVQKTYIIGNSVMATTGSGILGDYFLCTIVDEFNKTIKTEIPTSQIIIKFLKYCEDNFIQAKYLTISRNIFIAVGYEGNKPIMSTYNGIYNEYSLFKEGAVGSDKSTFSAKYSKTKDAETLGNFAANAIYQYAKDHNKVNTIGGDVRVVKVTPKGIIWIKNKPNCKWFDIASFVRDYKKGMEKIYFTSINNKNIFMELMKDYDK